MDPNKQTPQIMNETDTSKGKYVVGIIVMFSVLFVAIGAGLFMYIQSYSKAAPNGYSFAKFKKAAQTQNITETQSQISPTQTPIPVMLSEEEQEVTEINTSDIEQEVQDLSIELNRL